MPARNFLVSYVLHISKGPKVLNKWFILVYFYFLVFTNLVIIIHNIR